MQMQAQTAGHLYAAFGVPTPDPTAAAALVVTAGMGLRFQVRCCNAPPSLGAGVMQTQRRLGAGLV
jgi:hypothetical protein